MKRFISHRVVCFVLRFYEPARCQRPWDLSWAAEKGRVTFLLTDSSNRSVVTNSVTTGRSLFAGRPLFGEMIDARVCGKRTLVPSIFSDKMLPSRHFGRVSSRKRDRDQLFALATSPSRVLFVIYYLRFPITRITSSGYFRRLKT